jgi:predicted Zn-dependent protease
MKKIILLIIASAFLLSGCKTIQLDTDMIRRVASASGKAIRPISEEEEYYVGRAVAASLLSSYPLLKNTKLTGYVNSIGQTIALHSDKPFTHGGYHFAVLDSDEINAFACPGGTILITKGMLKSVRNEDELAAVLAHEIAHISHRDGISAISKSRWTEALTIIGSETARASGSRDLSRLANILEGSIDDVLKTLVVNGYGRTQEREADKKALSYLAKAGYAPSSFKDFLERLVEQGGSSEGGILKTHPATSDRITNVTANMPSETADRSHLEKRTYRFSRSQR